MTVDDKLFYDIDSIHYSSQYFYKPFEWQNVEISEIFGGMNGHMECSNIRPAFPIEFYPTRGEH